MNKAMSVDVATAKLRLASLLNRVAKGEQITITKKGVPAAVLTPVATKGKLDIKKLIADLRSLAKQFAK
ncbi:MAG: type II toxin-antitoxin system prevent-host-death family antitoxin [Gammaproteobacteria bacterium]